MYYYRRHEEKLTPESDLEYENLSAEPVVVENAENEHGEAAIGENDFKY